MDYTEGKSLAHEARHLPLVADKQHGPKATLDQASGHR